MRVATLLTLCGFLLWACSEPPAEAWPPEKSPATIGRLVTQDLLSRDLWIMRYDNEDVTSIHYAEACTAFGAIRLAGLLGDTVTLRQLSERYLRVITDSLTNSANHVDANVYGILPLELFRQTGDSIFFAQGMALADSQWVNPRPDGLTQQARFWIDDVWMIGSLQIQAYRVTGAPRYLDRAAAMAVAYLDRLQQPNGLFFHGEDSHFYWGRGNGWVAAGLAEILSELPPGHPDYPAVKAGYARMMAALLQYQAEDGMWRQLVDHPNAWKETSSTGMFAYAMTMGVNKGILPADAYEAACRRAWSALTGYLQPDGKITDVCVGTGKGFTTEYYLERPTVTGDLHGQAPVLWLAWAMLEGG
ncbi:MAG: glycoside hydrolase family 88 protein [Lewinella sp.]|nr:glycoside hydrolase family 88 protein [Lewinella sp.]